jgi:hypothetical protein
MTDRNGRSEISDRLEVREIALLDLNELLLRRRQRMDERETVVEILNTESQVRGAVLKEFVDKSFADSAAATLQRRQRG